VKRTLSRSEADYFVAATHACAHHSSFAWTMWWVKWLLRLHKWL